MRSAMAGGESPTRRPSSATRSLASPWSSATMRRSMASSGSKVRGARFLRSEGNSIPTSGACPFIERPQPSYAPPVRQITQSVSPPSRTGGPRPSLLDRLPPQSFFAVSAVFHYLGPSPAVLLFTRVDVLGVAWLRIATAAAVFALWRRPWRLARQLDRGERLVLVQLGAVLAAMNSLFYLAVDRLPLATVGAVEFLATVLLAALGTRARRNAAALVLTTLGVAAITDVRLSSEPVGFLFAFANCALFMLYVVLGHRIANSGGGRMRGIDQLGASMLVAAVV